jgi:predicted outer membrane repeat protein
MALSQHFTRILRIFSLHTAKTSDIKGSMGRATRFAIGLLLYAVALPVHAATITVTNTNDSGAGSLRQALADANNGDTINFAVTGTIALTSGGLVVARNVTISGPGANQISIDGNQATFVFGVIPQKTVSISGLLITNGEYGIWNQQGTLTVTNCVLSGNSFNGLYNDGGSSGGASMAVANSIISNNSRTGVFNVLPSPDGSGCACMTITDGVVSNNGSGGILNVGNNFGNGTANLTVVNTNVSDNDGSGISNNGSNGSATATILSTTVSGNSAGGVDTQGILPGQLFGSAGVTITECIISNNSANGGIRSTTSALTVANSTISGNSSGDTGGGLFASSVIIGGPQVAIVNSTISGHSAGTSGGGIYGGATVENSTISDNSAGVSGGGIYGGATVMNSTISGNSAGTSGGGLYNNSSLIVRNTILNAGASGENIFNDGGTVTSLGYNLSSDDAAGYLTWPRRSDQHRPLAWPLAE